MNVASAGLREELGRGAEYFTRGLALEHAERYLRGLMRREADPNRPELGPIRYEIGMLFGADRGLIKAVKGVAASPGQAASVDPVEMFMGVAGDDLVFSHNHPGGTPLSVNDLFATARRGAVETRAVGPDFTFVMTMAGMKRCDQLDVMLAYGIGERAWSTENARYRAYRADPKFSNCELGENLAVDKGMEKLRGCMTAVTHFRGGRMQFQGPTVADYLKHRAKYYGLTIA